MEEHRSLLVTLLLIIRRVYLEMELLDYVIFTTFLLGINFFSYIKTLADGQGALVRVL